MTVQDAVRGRGQRKALRPKVRRTQEERSAETRGKLVQAAIRVLHDSGYANLTISKVAERAGLTNGAMQHHFTSRGDLLLAVLDALYPVFEIPFDQIAARNLSVRERVDVLVDLLWQIYSRAEYLTIWDVAFGTRGEPELRAKLQSYQRDIAARMRKSVCHLFADISPTSADEDKVFSIFSLVISYLRGLAVQLVFGVDRRSADLAQIKDIACERLKQLPGRK